MGEIALNGLEFFAYHGVYKTERDTGNKFGIDLLVSYDISAAENSDELECTLNYEELYAIVREIMAHPVNLLEHLAYKIANKILDKFDGALDVEVKVKKYNPPIGGICNNACITLKLEK